jgi:hypothetical protein
LGLIGKRQSGKEMGNHLPIAREEQSSEGQSPRALEAERGFQGWSKLNTIERVAKP